MPTELLNRVLATIERYDMTRPGDRVAVAVSGGGDSVGLLLLLDELRSRLGVTLAAVHLNHQLRRTAADEDEDFVRDLAAARGLACFVRSTDVGKAARRKATNVEEEGRRQRYAFFRQIVRAGHATRVATAHTADDQAETVLSRLGRGTGLRGLSGIHPVLGAVVRPLLEVHRSELRAYLDERGQAWREDESNQDTSRLRARLRHRVLPAFERECGAGLVEKLARVAELARRDDALLADLVEERFALLAQRSRGGISIRACDLLDPWPGCTGDDAREALARRLADRIAREAARDLRGLGSNHVARILHLARTGTSGRRIELPGHLLVERVLDHLIFSAAEEQRRAADGGVSYAYAADAGAHGDVTLTLAETGTRFRLKSIDWPPAGSETYSEGWVALDADRVQGPLVLRNWLPGDAYRPLGRGRAEKLKRLLLDRRVAAKLRSGWPVLTSAGRPVWARGLPIAAEYAAGPTTRRALLIREDGDVRGHDATDETQTRREASNQLSEARVTGSGFGADPERGQM